jgi:hypothetical protein
MRSAISPFWHNRRARFMLSIAVSLKYCSEEMKMAKGLNQKKDTKKKPEKTLKEKRADKAAKKGK